MNHLSGIHRPTCRHGSAFLSTACLAAAILASPTSALGGDLDVSAIGTPRVIQSIQPGTLPYIAGKPAFARCAIIATGNIPPGTLVDGVMRVFVDGVESPDSPIYSDNGPIAPTPTASPDNENDSLNFVFLPVVSTDVVLTFEVNPAGPGQVFETDFANNVSTIGPLDFEEVGVAEFVYVPIDYRINGQTMPNLPDENLIKPGVGDNYSQAIFPAPYGEYHRSAAPSKLWTTNVDDLFGSGGSQLLSSLATDLAMMVPQPDFIYGWIPGALPNLNGLSIGIPGEAAFGNTDPVRHQRTFSHELGHLFGLSHNSTLSGSVGIDVERHLNITQGLPLIKSASLNDIMVAGQVTSSAWVAPGTVLAFKNHPSFAPGTLQASAPGDSMLVSGLWNHARHEFELLDTFTLAGSRPTATVPADVADLVLRLYTQGQLVQEAGVLAGSTTDCGVAGCAAERASGADSPIGFTSVGSFVAVLPTPDADAIDLLEIVDASSGDVVHALQRSASRPMVGFVSPSAAVVESSVHLEWTGSDADGDALTYAVRYSPDGERMVPLGSGLRGTSLDVDLADMPALRAGRGFFELIASDGLRTSRVRTQRLALAGAGGGNAPWVNVYTPDSGFSYPFGGTVILRSSGWDLEDLALTGKSIQWTSDLDGPIGSGRVDKVATLSVGTHVLTVTATDSDGMTSSDTTTITIVDRSLPGKGGPKCQANIGFGGPGTALLEACGGDLSTGTSVDISLTGAAPSTVVFFGVSTASNPTPFLGGTVVTVPTVVLISDMTDANGDWTLSGVPGGGGPFSFFVQTAFLDGSQSEGFGFSNAVRLDYLP